MFAGLLALVVLVVRLYPTTPLGRSLHRAFVERPLEIAGRVERKHIILIFVLLCSGQTLALAGSAELALAIALDMSAYVDALIAGYVAVAALRFRSTTTASKNALARIGRALARPRRRARRTRAVPRNACKAANDDDRPSVLIASAA